MVRGRCSDRTRDVLPVGAAAGQVIIGAEVAATVTSALTAARPTPGRTAFPQLSDRDLEILDRLARGLDNTTIARQLHLAPKTIRNQVSALIAKLGATDRADAMRVARAAGLGGQPTP
jgi:DNA-binding NarL/FixJ family response regulator